MMDTYEAYVLEVKGAQQALGQNQDWVDQRLNEVKQELSQAQEALERFLAEAMVLATNREYSTMPERTPVTRRTLSKTQRILFMERDVHQLLQEVDKVVKESSGHVRVLDEESQGAAGCYAECWRNTVH